MLTAMLDSKYRGRRKGVPVREGSVRQARNEANLSLAQVADGKVSRTAIHLIETGRSQPSMETLEQIARQTRKPLDYFLAVPEPGPDVGQLETELRDVERLTLIRDFQRVIEVGSALLEKQLGEQDTALVRFYVGQSCCRLVQPNEALYHLTLARAV